MKASVNSVRIAPKKANLIARLVRGLAVPDAIEALRRTHKKGARIVETLLQSAVANTSHNLKQDPQTMIVKTIVVNQGTAYHRGVPMARGRVRPMRKFLSHIEIELGFEDVPQPGRRVPEKKDVKKKPSTKKSTSPAASSK